MTRLDQAIEGLKLAVASAEGRMDILLDGVLSDKTLTAQAREDHLSDHRAAVAGDLAAALDLIVPGLGGRWMQALHPELPLWLEHQRDELEQRAYIAALAPPAPAAPGRLQ